MKKMKFRYFLCIVCSIIMLLFTASCSNRAQEGPEKEQELERARYQSETPQVPQSLPDLQGGSELTGREQKPVSNYILQRRYPGILVLRGSLNDNRVALTFDDGPDPRFTPKVLDVLKRYNVKGTFFLVGARAAAHEGITRRIRDEGHAIGNHSYWHPNLDKEGVARAQWEASETEKVLQRVVGYRPKLFRAPYGSLNDELVKKLGDMNFTVVGWSVDSSDWMQLTAKQIENNVLSNVHPGAIILMHDAGHWTMNLQGTVDSLNSIIPKLQKDGMKLVTVPELFGIRDRK